MRRDGECAFTVVVRVTAEHQDYLEKNPHDYICHCVRPGWMLAHREVQST